MSLPELHEEIDRSFGDGPAHRPVSERIQAGRTALVRRRVTAGVAALAVVAALGGTTWALAPGGDPRAGEGYVATDPPPTPGESESAAPAWEDNTPLRYLDGELQIRPGVVVHDRIENPYGYQPPKKSDALDITFEGKRQWAIVRLTERGYGYSSTAPSNGWASFSAYVADQVDGATGGDDGWPETLRLTDQGTVVASPGSEILQRTDDPRLGDSFAPAGTPTGAALVRAAEDDFAYFVVWRVIDGKLDVITTPPDDVVGATFDELVSYARSQYDSGEGLR
ncbi:hypothetical protein [Nocardioides sp.]|uniref:hypothetical protein n=1 Tax=Nocardioides sp. TaxID=35761 RepID=UPI0035620656